MKISNRIIVYTVVGSMAIGTFCMVTKASWLVLVGMSVPFGIALRSAFPNDFGELDD